MHCALWAHGLAHAIKRMNQKHRTAQSRPRRMDLHTHLIFDHLYLHLFLLAERSHLIEVILVHLQTPAFLSECCQETLL